MNRVINSYEIEAALVELGCDPQHLHAATALVAGQAADVAGARWRKAHEVPVVLSNVWPLSAAFERRRP